MLIVHRNTCTPTGSPVILVFRFVGVTMVPPPLTEVQMPAAGAGAALPFIVTDVAGVQMEMSGPALAAGCALL